jgi:putative PEP-CTERM system TPR-repeat lipoprotein
MNADVMKKAVSSGVGAKRLGAAGLALSGVLLVGCFGKTADQYVAEAKTALGKKDEVGAVLQLKNALQENPSLAEARFLLGKTSLELGDARGAVIELEKAKELGYAADEVVPLLARALLAAGQSDKLLRGYADARLGSPAATADLQATLATAYNMQGKPAKAMELASAAVAADGGNLHAQLVRIRLLAASSGAAEGLKALSGLAESSIRTVEAVQLKGELLRSLGRNDEAVAAFREALSIDKTSSNARAGLVASLLARKDLDEAKKELEPLRKLKGGAVQFRTLSILLALEKNQLEEAHEHVLALVPLAPDNAESLYLAGVVEYRRGALLEADKHLSKAVQVAPDFAPARRLLAQTNLRVGNVAKALTALQPLQAENSSDAEALAIAGGAYLLQGESRRAEESFSRAAKADPKSGRNQVALALLQIAKGKADEGLAALQTIAGTDTGTVADMALISTLMNRKDWDAALKAVGRLQAKMPGKPAPSNLRGRIELLRGNRDKARMAFEEAVKLDPAYFPATAGLAEMDVEDKHPDAAMARYEKILAADPRNGAASMAIVSLRAKAGASPDELKAMLTKLIQSMPSDVRPRLALIELQMNALDVKGALATAQDAVTAAPDSAEAWRFLAQAQAIAGNGNQAISSFNKLISLQPEAPEPYMLLARFYTVRGDKANATATVKRALSIKPDYQPGQVALVRAELDAGNPTLAHKIVDEMRAQHPDDAVVYALNGDIHVTQSNWAEAATAYRAALKLRAEPEVAIKLHRVLVAGAKPSEAKQFETEWLAKHPQDAAFIHYLGDMALLQKNYELAEQRYLTVLKLRPNNASAANNLAWVLSQAKKPGALAYAEMANKLAPNKPAFMDTLAQLLAGAGELGKAIELQKQALALDAEQPEHRLHLARFYVDAGKKAEAREELQRLAALGNKFPLQAEVNSLMGRL